MNKVILLGRLTRDPDLRFAAGTGNAVTRFTVAIARQFKRDETDFVNCVAFGKSAETIAQYLTKGRQIALTGNIRTGSYDGQDGSKRYTTDVVVESFEFVGYGKDMKGNESPSAFDDDMTPVDDSDAPF